MSPDQMCCLYCGQPAFCVINVELRQGRGRWPTCANFDHIRRALVDVEARTINAAHQERRPDLAVRQDAIVVDAIEVGER